MFRRKPRSKNSLLVLRTSNRGSDIVRPNNTSLIVNESDTEEANLRRELTSIFSEDEDDNLGDTPRKSASLMKSFSQKKQSTPLSQSLSQKSQLERSNGRERKQRPSRTGNKVVSVSETRNTYFEEVLKAGGAVPLPENSSFLMSEDQAVFSIKINNKLKESTGNVKKFVNSIEEYIKDYKNLQKMLVHTLTDENCKAARGPVQQPLMRMLLNVECLQSDLIELLLKTVADYIVDNKMESENIQLVPSILCQMRFLYRVNDIKIASKLLEILHVATVNVKREIIFLLPEIICEEETEETCIQLMEMLKFDEMLTHVIIDAMSNLPMTTALRSTVCSKILHRLDKCPLEFLPSLVQFVLNKCQADELIAVVNGLRKNLPFSPQHFQMRMAKRSGKNDSDDSYIKLTFENLKFSMMASKEVTETWIKVISGFNSSVDFRCVDMIMLIIFYSCLFGRKSQILQLIRNKIKSTVLTQQLVQNMFKTLSVVAEEYSSTILEIASVLLKSFDTKISSFGSLLYKECFTYFHPYMKQIVISEVLLHIGTGPSATINIALTTLKELCVNQKESLSHHITSIMGLLVNLADLDLMQVRLLMDVIADLIFFEPCENGNAAKDELQMFIRKQLISTKPEQCKKGILAAIMFVKHSAKDEDSEETDELQSNSLLELAMSSNGASDTKRGFFNDEFAAMAKESRLSKSFLKIWSKRTFSLVMHNLFVKNVDVDCADFPVSAQYSLEVEGIQRLIFPVAELIIKSNEESPTNVSVPVIPSTLKLLSCLVSNVNTLLPLFCASVVMPETTVYDNFSSFDENQQKTIMECLFLCGNYLIECVNALCAFRILDKALLRVKQLISVRQLIARYIDLIPDFVPPPCQFYAPVQKVSAKKKVSEKKPKKGRKRKLSEVAAETSSTLDESRRSEKTLENILPEEQTPPEADLFPYSCFFRELDFLTTKLLLTDFKADPSPELFDSGDPQLETRDILFLLEDVIFKSEQMLKPTEQTFNLKAKPASLIQKVTPEEFITTSVNILPGLLNKIETFSKYCENLLESNDWIHDSRGLFTEGACHVKMAMAAGLKFIANIISWQGFYSSNDKLLEDILTILTGRCKSSENNPNLEPAESLSISASKYLTSFSKTVLVLSGGLSIVKSFQACLRRSSIESCTALADVCHEFLSRSWFTVTGTTERGSIYNQHVDFLLKTYFSFVENKLEVVRDSAKTTLKEVEGLTGKDSTLKTFKTINKNNFPLLYRTMCETLASTSAKEVTKAGSDHEKQLSVWNKVVETLLNLVETAKIHSSRVILASLLKRSQSIIHLFLGKGMPLVESALRVKSVEVLTLLKSFQVVTRFLHSICCHSRVTNDSLVAAHVPPIRSLCERLTLEVKGMLILNGIPMECITIAILKNRDIKGNDIISQSEPDDEEEANQKEEEEEADQKKNEEETESVPEPIEAPPEKPKLCCSTRLLISIIFFVAIFNVTYVRVGISMALVCMVIPEGKTRESEKRGEFVWSSSMKGYLISAIFYGFLVGPFVAGFLSFKVGGKLILMIGTIGTSITFCLAPEFARVSPVLLFALRVVTGFFAGFTFPAFYDLVSHWIVPEERQLLVTGALVGIPAANIVNFPISSFICHFCGWVWLFYSLAIWMFLCCLCYFYVVYDHPKNCRFISQKELRFLKSRIPHAETHRIPWKKVFKSLPIYAYIVIHFCVNYVYLTMIFSLPLLMKNVHHISLKQNGLLSATPYVGSFVVRILLSLFFEQLRAKLKLSKNALRKAFVFLGAVLVSLFLLTATFLSYKYWVLGCFILASSSLELCLTGGYLLSLLDLCPSYVNILTGIANAIGNTAGLISPVVNGLITAHQTKEEWDAVFYVNISILLGAMVFYLVFGQNELQYWGLATLPTPPPLPRGSLVN